MKRNCESRLDLLLLVPTSRRPFLPGRDKALSLAVTAIRRRTNIRLASLLILLPMAMECLGFWAPWLEVDGWLGLSISTAATSNDPRLVVRPTDRWAAPSIYFSPRRPSVHRGWSADPFVLPVVAGGRETEKLAEDRQSASFPLVPNTIDRPTDRRTREVIRLCAKRDQRQEGR